MNADVAGPTALLEEYRGIICDLDGVVYRGADPVPHAVAALEEARRRGVGIVYATNNASRPPADVGAQLAGFGLGITARSVVGSSQAGAAHLAHDLAPGSAVLAVGGPGVTLALTEAGLRPVSPAEAAAGEGVVAVLQGYGAQVGWADLAEAAYAIQGGARWVATNTDMTLPTARGIAPGNGSLVACVRAAVGADPVVVGKPETPLYELSAQVLGTTPTQTLAIGDRLDTDIEGAVRAGMDSLWVATGVNSVVDVALAPPAQRPTYLAFDLRALAEPYAAATLDPGTVRASCGSARAEFAVGELVLEGGSASERMRALVVAAWAGQDSGRAPSPGDLRRLVDGLGEPS